MVAVSVAVALAVALALALIRAGTRFPTLYLNRSCSTSHLASLQGLDVDPTRSGDYQQFKGLMLTFDVDAAYEIPYKTHPNTVVRVRISDVTGASIPVRVGIRVRVSSSTATGFDSDLVSL